MVTLAERFGVDEGAVARIPDLAGEILPAPDALFDAAYAIGASDPQAASLLLASALLSESRNTPEGRRVAVLQLLAPLVARADPEFTMGEKGKALRATLLPNGWRHTVGSWTRLRYAWREGLVELLHPRSEDATLVQAIDELTRLTPAEPEPVSVAIREQWPSPGISFGVTAASLAIAGWALSRDLTRDRARPRSKRKASPRRRRGSH